MSILIRGMEMPRRGMVVNIYGDGRVTNHFDEFGKTIGKAVPVPPHGRLIDADALMNKFQELYDERECEARYTGSKEIKVSWNEAVYQIIKASTIIEAEK